MNKNRLHILFIITGIFLSLTFWTCSDSQKNEDLEIDFGYDYYPLVIGKNWTYQVDSVIFQPGLRGIIKDSTRSFLKEIIIDTTTSLDGELQYIIERYHRPTEETPWRIAKVFTRSRSKTQASLTEDNLRFITMPFPLDEGKRWDGHVYFDINRLFPVGGEFLIIYKDWEYSVAELGDFFQINGQTYEDVATIQQANYTESSTNARVAQEKYARDIGLIYREWFIGDSQCQYCCGGNTGPSCQAVPWEERVEKGLYLRQILIAHE